MKMILDLTISLKIQSKLTLSSFIIFFGFLLLYKISKAEEIILNSEMFFQ